MTMPDRFFEPPAFGKMSDGYFDPPSEVPCAGCYGRNDALGGDAPHPELCDECNEDIAKG